jgi:transposase-like protein
LLNLCAIKFFRAVSLIFSWTIDEAYIKVKGVWKYLYLAMGKEGKKLSF